MSESTHAKLAPSAAERWLKCPGSIKLCANLADVESPYAAEGTFAHAIAADCLRTGEDAVRMIGHTNNIFTCDEQMAAYVQEYLDVVREVHDPDELPGVGLLESTLFVERKVSLVGVRPDIYGTADAIVVSHNGKTLSVFDLKYGAGVFVDVEDNPQLKLYALGALLSMPECAKIEHVCLYVVQPRHYSGGCHYFSLSSSDLLAKFAAEIQRGAAATDASEAKVNPGEHCRWCLAKPHCPTLRAAALERTKHLFDDRAMSAHRLVPVKSPPPVGSLTTAEIANALEVFPLIEEWMKAVREHAYDRAAKGDVAPGFKLVDKTGNRKWTDESAAELVLEAYDANPYAKPKLLSPAQAEKMLPKLQREILMRQLAVKPKTGTVLVPASDKRPAITAGDVFDNLSVK